jgi:hypothetical protein
LFAASVIFEVRNRKKVSNTPCFGVLTTCVVACFAGQILVQQHVTVRCAPFELTPCAGSQRHPSFAHTQVTTPQYHGRLPRTRGQRRAHANVSSPFPSGSTYFLADLWGCSQVPRHLRRQRRGRAHPDHGPARGDVGGAGALHGRADRLRVGHVNKHPPSNYFSNESPRSSPRRSYRLYRLH